MKLIVFAECYANYWFASRLGLKPTHKWRMGRDVILHEIDNIREKDKNIRIIAIIDYEEGKSRVNIDKRFNLTPLTDKIVTGILFGIQSDQVIAVIFDPKIEDIFIKLEPKLRGRGREIKSKDAHKILSILDNNDKFKNDKFTRVIEECRNHLSNYIHLS